MLSLVPTALNRVCQKSLINRGSRSDINFRGKPKCRKTARCITFANCSAVIVFVIGSTIFHFVSIQTNTTTSSYLSQSRKVRNQVKRYVFKGPGRYLVRLKESMWLVSRCLVTLAGNTAAYIVLSCPLRVGPPKRSGHCCQ
jgi:hypothetical protein